MGLFSRLFRSDPKPSEPPDGRECVLIHLDGTSLPDEVYQQCDAVTMSGELVAHHSR